MAPPTSVTPTPAPSLPQLPVEQAVMDTPSDFLCEFREINPDLPIDFFTPEEGKLIQSLFNHHLTSTLCLIDLLGFNFYQSISNLKEACQALDKSIPSKKFDDLIEDFCHEFFSFYLRIFRNCSDFNPATSAKVLDELILTEQKFVQELEGLRKALSQLIPRLATLMAKQGSSPQSTETLMVKYRAAMTELTRLKEIKELWAKIIQSPFCRLFLVDRKVSCFKGFETLQTPPADDDLIVSKKAATRSILSYLKFLDIGFQKQGLTRWVPVDFLGVLHELVSSQLSQPVTIPFIEKWNYEFHDMIIGLQRSGNQAKQDLDLACSGRLTSKQWQKKNFGSEGTPLEPAAFIERLNLMHLFLSMAEISIEDANTIVELHFFKPFIPDTYRPKPQTVVAIMHNLKLLSEWELPSGTSPSNFLQLELYQACRPFISLIQSAEQQEVFLTLYGLVEKNECPYRFFLNFVTTLKMDSLIDDLEKKLPTIQQEYKQLLARSLERVPEDQRAKWKNQVELDYLKQILNLFRVVSTLHDIQKIQEKKSFLRDFDYVLRPSFREFFLFQVSLDELCNRSSEPPTLSEELEAPLPAPEVKPTQKIKPSETNSSALQATPRRESSKQDLLKRLKEARKRREFENVLKELEFFFLRQGKGHQIWSNDEGSQIVLPFHNNSSTLKPGTQHSIVRQVADSLKKH